MAERTILAVDIGNTNVALALFQGERMVLRRTFPSSQGKLASNVEKFFSLFCQEARLKPEKDIHAVGIGSVVPEVTQAWRYVLRTRTWKEPLMIHGTMEGVRNRYHNPKAVGPDRICNAVAGYHKHGGPLIVVDMGTAMTLDVVDANGAFLGGAILPGLEVSTDALEERAALLPRIQFEMPKKFIGRTTDENLRIGLMRGAVGGLRSLIQGMRRELNDPDTKVIATGGIAKILAPHIIEIFAIEPHLVLEGIRLLVEKAGPQPSAKPADSSGKE